MFPNLDKDVIDDVVRMKEGRLVLRFNEKQLNILLTRPLTLGLAWLSTHALR